MRDERDEFWDVGKLLPKTKKKSVMANYDTTAALITDGQSIDTPSSELSLGCEPRAAHKNEEKLLCEYSSDGAFLGQVRIYSQESAFRYYEDFEYTMHKYMRLTVKQAEKVPFFSYVPQYSQLSSARLSWYLYWRSACRRREYLQTDYSYVQLYVFELLNFTNPKHPEVMIEELCSLWSAYRGEFPQLDRCMPDWVCDYALIHRVALPYELISPFLDEVLSYCSLREFYLGATDESRGAYTRAVIMGATGYNYKKSKYYTKENKALYDEHILGACEYALAASSDGFSRLCEDKEYSSMRRDAYAGALCTYKAKRIIVIEYLPLYRSGKLRAEATFAVKYAENRLRAYLGIRSRLSVTGIDAKIKDSIDEYFREHLSLSPSAVGSNAAERMPADYMAYYDAPTADGGFESAQAIEEGSWETAELMAECFDDSEQVPSILDSIQITEEPQAEMPDMSQTDSEDTPPFDEMCRAVLALIYEGKSEEAARVAVSGGRFIGEVCESINDLALDFMGDIIVECGSGEYHIIEDYESEVEQWLRI